MRKLNIYEPINEGLWQWIKNLFKMIFGSHPKYSRPIAKSKWSTSIDDALNTIDPKKYKLEKDQLNQLFVYFRQIASVIIETDKENENTITEAWEEMAESWSSFILNELVNDLVVKDEEEKGDGESEHDDSELLNGSDQEQLQDNDNNDNQGNDQEQSNNNNDGTNNNEENNSNDSDRVISKEFKDDIKQSYSITFNKTTATTNSGKKKTSKANNGKTPSKQTYKISIDGKNNKYTTSLDENNSGLVVLVDDDGFFKITTNEDNSIYEGKMTDWVKSFFKKNNAQNAIKKVINDGLLAFDKSIVKTDGESELEFYERILAMLEKEGLYAGSVRTLYSINDNTIDFLIDCPELLVENVYYNDDGTLNVDGSNDTNNDTNNDTDNQENNNGEQNSNQENKITSNAKNIKDGTVVSFNKGGDNNKSISGTQFGNSILSLAISLNGKFKVTTNNVLKFIEIDDKLNYRLDASTQYVKELFTFFKPLIKEEKTKDIIATNIKMLVDNGIVILSDDLSNPSKSEDFLNLARIIRESQNQCYCGKLKDDYQIDNDGNVKFDIEYGFMITNETVKSTSQQDQEEADDENPSEETGNDNKENQDGKETGKFELLVGDKVKDKDGNKIGEVTKIEDDGKMITVKDKKGEEARYSYEQYPDLTKDDNNEENSSEENNSNELEKIEQIKDQLKDSKKAKDLVNAFKEAEFDDGYIKNLTRNIDIFKDDKEAMLLYLKDQLDEETYNKAKEFIDAMFKVKDELQLNESMFNKFGMKKPFKKFTTLYF